MAQNFTVARPYAKALFAFALEQNQPTTWQELLHILGLLVQDPSMQTVLVNPEITDARKVDVICDTVKAIKKDLSDEIETRLRHILSIVAQAKRLEALPDIATLYQQMLAKEESIVEVDVISAYPLELHQQENLQQALERRFNSKVSMGFSTDENLIGGALIRAGNWVLDGSIQGKLARLSESLN